MSKFLTKYELLEELKSLGFDMDYKKGICTCKLKHGVSLLGLHSKLVTVRINDVTDLVKFSSSSFDNIGMRGHNGPTLHIDVITKSMLYDSLIEACPEFKEIVRDNKLDSLLDD